ncbi:MAG: DNA-processing protein DprA, partial [Burkholderiaceae bacterium]
PPVCAAASIPAASPGGLQGTGGTVAVIGTGIDKVYPARHRDLAHRIVEHGCIVSEYHIGTPAAASNFPRRNRIISGLAKGVLVVEAADKSGSLITARVAAEQGREVFAIPGSIHSPLARGCHLLIKQGAKLVECASDILEELTYSLPVQEPKIETRPKMSDDLLAQMGYDPISFEILLERCAMDSANLSARIFDLELEGMIEMLPGGKLRRLH